MASKELRLSLPAQELAALLRFAVIPTLRGNDVPLGLTGVHVRVGDDTFAGFGEDWTAAWAGVGVTVASTDRYRMHVGGAPVDRERAGHGEVLLSGQDVRVALASAPRTSNDVAMLEWDGGSDAVLRWPRSTFKVTVLNADFPKYRTIIDNAPKADPSDGAHFTGKYVGQAVTACAAIDHKVRMRIAGLRPAMVAPATSETRAVRVGALVMPVRVDVR